MINYFNTTLKVIKIWDYIVTSGEIKSKQQIYKLPRWFTIPSNICDGTILRNYHSAALIGKLINSTSKHKSEVKIQLKIKFPQAVITNISTLPPVFPKMFWTAAWWKTRNRCFWQYVCKTIYLCSGKVALTVFTEMCSASFFMEIKMLL